MKIKCYQDDLTANFDKFELDQGLHLKSITAMEFTFEEAEKSKFVFLLQLSL